MKAKKKLPLFDKIILWLNYAACLALLISCLAPITDPRKYWVVAFFGLAYPPILLANTLFIVYWAFRKSWYAIISIACILVGLNVFNNNIAFNSNDSLSATADSGAVKVMTYNVHSFKKYGAGRDATTKHEILEIIKQQSPDILGIQEYFTKKRGKYAMTDSVKGVLGYSNYYFQQVNFSTEEAIGVAIFSRFPIVNKGLILLGDITSENQCIYIDVKKRDKIFRVYSVHLQSINFKSEDYRYLDTVSKSGKTDLTSTKRLGGKIKRAFFKRAEQVLKIKAHAKACPYPYIIAGDFNDTPTSFAVNQMAKGLKNTFREKGFGLGRTYNGDFPNYQIDYVMVTPQFNVKSYAIIEKKLSDHYPIVTNLVLK